MTSTQYTHPGTLETFTASTPEHAAARVFGGKPSDYLATRRESGNARFATRFVPTYIEVMRVRDGSFLGDISIHTETKRAWTLGTVTNTQGTTHAARKHVGDNVIQVATQTGEPAWRSATSYETTTFTPLPTAALPV
jgi:hypothetical protein